MPGNDKFPIIFKTMKGAQKERNFSFFNVDEQICVLKLIEQLMKIEFKDDHGQFTRKLCESDIGVVSPYRKQCEDLSKALGERQLNKITVGTAENFQGQERLVIIISTVRSDGKLGFLKDKRVCTMYMNLYFLPFFNYYFY